MKIWAALRKFISHHRSFIDTDWALPAAEVDRVKMIYERFTPSDPILQRSWLFGNGVPLLSGRDVGNWEQRDKDLMKLQQQAVRELILSNGVEAIYRLVGLVGNPRQVGIAYGLIDEFKGAADQTLLDTLGSKSPGSRDFVKGIAGARFYEEKEPWALMMVEAAVKGFYLKRLLWSYCSPSTHSGAPGTWRQD